jgi:hypothetical protein
VVVAAAGNDVEDVKSSKDDLRIDAVSHLRIFLYGGVGGMAIHVGVRGRDCIVMVVSGAIVASVRASEEVDSLRIRKDKCAVGVQIEEAAIEGRAHILSLFDWGSFKSGFRNMGITLSSVINDLDSLRRNRGEGEVWDDKAISARVECGGSTWHEEGMTCIASNAEGGERRIILKGRK